ncbi:hypothetical protein FGW37_33135 [Streptomyces rectiverticillatus]|uniref:hypothetical protein n=1 Tax=Streptomyces rectiverticillatus TaxID=173860 RepID=UPI0015C3FD13|nr:hypothetical protein [Streptomyces rectiverticillatus]QLE70220.1 hypothetical protein FGW37_00040 [Streptomyces rectiverticillatus]QLE75780.1 hypothetical protein FGW37_33135 [Streptomyces rectiverticillatus]
MFEEVHHRPCGRPTKSGAPCRAQFSGPGFACKLHTTDHERTLVEAYRQGLETGRAQEREWRQRTEAAQVEHLERQIRALREELDARNRRFEVDSDQAVTVDGYGYRWRGPGRLEVGDRVLLPENYVSALRHGPGPFPGTVTELGTTYTGNLSTIISRAPAASRQTG